MKYLIIVGDGMADYPVEEFSGKTPLQVAEHPNMDLVVAKGRCGMLKTIPKGMAAGSDTANLSILGYDPRKLRIGRGPLEAASLGVKLHEEDLAFRCNLITEENGILLDYSAGHIESRDAEELISCIDKAFGRPGEVEFYNGVSYRHTLVLRGKRFSDQVTCFPPHDVMGSPISDVLIKSLSEEGKSTADFLNRLVIESREILSSHPVNRRRKERGEREANMIWFWGLGRKPKMSTLWEKYKIRGAVISAVDLIKGIGYYAGMEIIDVPGATGLYDTNYEGKANYALKSLSNHDFVYIHVEAPDEAGHMGDFELKVRTIEDLDKRLLRRVLDSLEGDYVISVLTDHPTPVKVRTHTSDPVPFAIYNNTIEGADDVNRFDEFAVRNGLYGTVEGHRFMSLILRKKV